MNMENKSAILFSCKRNNKTPQKKAMKYSDARQAGWIPDDSDMESEPGYSACFDMYGNLVTRQLHGFLGYGFVNVHIWRVCGSICGFLLCCHGCLCRFYIFGDTHFFLPILNRFSTLFNSRHKATCICRRMRAVWIGHWLHPCLTRLARRVITCRWSQAIFNSAGSHHIIHLSFPLSKLNA